MKLNQSRSVWTESAALAATLFLPISNAHATLIGTASQEADGRYLYSYTLLNERPDGFVTNWSLDHDVATPDWIPADVATPLGWAVDWLVSYPDLDFLADPGSELGAGLSITGFSFLSAYAPGLVTYYEFGFNSDFSDFGSVGSVIGPAFSTPVADSWHPLMPLVGFLSCVGLHIRSARRRNSGALLQG